MFNHFIHKVLTSSKHMACIFIVLLLIFLIDTIVYLTGGTEFAFTHLMYIPIIIAAFWGNIKFAFATAIIAGISVGPFINRNVSEEMAQAPKEWMFRIILFAGIGMVVGLLFQRIKVYKKQEIDKAFKNQLTGLPNANKLKLDLNRMIGKKKRFSLLTFQIINMEHINRYIDYEIGEKARLRVIDVLSNFVDKGSIYYIYSNELAVVMSKCSVGDAYLKGLKFMNVFKEPVVIEGYFIEMVLKGGVVHYPLHGSEPNDLFKKMELALDQASNAFDLCVYDAVTEKKNKEKYEIQVALYDAIKNNEFYLVYQPQISLEENRVMGFEVLLRWKHPQKGLINPEEFIKIAEDIGMISEITKWVIKNTIAQLKKWKEEQITRKVAINLSSKDLTNNCIIDFMKQCIKDSELDPTMIECEITERAVIENLNMVKFLLNDARDFGFKISLDDFGTGYNSLLNLMKLPIDYLKIDKYFIDRMKEEDDRIAINNMIQLAHNLEMEVIAEGVESKKQLEWLSDKRCDHIQGYYFSKPLLPEKITEYVLNFKGLTGCKNS